MIWILICMVSQRRNIGIARLDSLNYGRVRKVLRLVSSRVTELCKQTSLVITSKSRGAALC